MNHRTSPEEPYWWTCVPCLPESRESIAWTRLRRVFCDRTWTLAAGPYSYGTEIHLTVNFFENFSLLPGFGWIEALLARVGVLDGHLTSAAWSYEYENPRSFLLADVVVAYVDSGGPGILVLETKRAGRLGKNGVGEKDDPWRGHYLAMDGFAGITRKNQMLVLSRAAVEQLPAGFRTGQLLITWEEFAALQRAAFRQAAGAKASEVDQKLRLHHSFLGIDCGKIDAAPAQSDSKFTLQGWDAWLDGLERYVCWVKRGEQGSPPDWLVDEPRRTALIDREDHGPGQRQAAIWRVGHKTDGE